MSDVVVNGVIHVPAAEIERLQEALAASETRERRLREALRAIEAHHAEQNRIKGRRADESYTLHVVRAALAPEGEEQPR